MTDLSLILFMITAAALREAPAGTGAPEPPTVPAEGEPVALWRVGSGAPSLRAWLAETGRDPRLLLTVHAPLAQVSEALALANGLGRPVRIVLEPQPGAGTYAALSYDRGMARGLQDHPSGQLSEKARP